MRVFVLAGLLFGTAFVFLTPPFQVPDEPQHFYRAFQVSELPLVALVALRGDPRRVYEQQRLLPRSLADLVENSDLVRTQFRPTNKVNPSKLLASLRQPLNPRERESLAVAPYSAVAYLPQATGIGLGRLLGAPPLVLFYLGRLCALGAWIALVARAIGTTPILGWTYGLLALMPMTLFLAASNSVDGVVIGVAFLLSAELLSWAYDAAKTRVSATDGARLLALAVVLALSKPPYLLLLALFLLVPREKFPRAAPRLLAFAGVVTACVVAYVASNLIAKWTTTTGPTIDLGRMGINASPLPDVSARRQLDFLLSDPWALPRVLGTTVATLHGFYLGSFVGVLGWLDTPLPPWLPYAYVAALIAVSLLGSGAGVRWTARALALAIFALTGLVSMVLIYVSFSSVGMSVVYGFQGRYLIPVAPMLFLVFHGATLRGRFPGALAVAAIAVVTVTTSVAGSRLVHRFYVVEIPSYAIEGVFASPSARVVTIKGWAVDRASGGAAAGVEVEFDGRAYPARYGLERADVAERWHRPAYRSSGFEVTIQVAEPGRHTLALRIVAPDGTSYVVPEQKLPLLLR